jgi:serine/threonine-protein kinase mTOR
LITSTDLLLEIPLGETNDSQRLYRYFNYATAPLASTDINVTVAASKVLGRIAEIGGSSFGEPFVDSRVENQIQVMTRGERGRYGAVLLLKELARHLPTWFAPHIALVFERLPLGFRDPRVRAFI